MLPATPTQSSVASLTACAVQLAAEDVVRMSLADAPRLVAGHTLPDASAPPATLSRARTLSDAQQIVARYRALQATPEPCEPAPPYSPTLCSEKERTEKPQPPLPPSPIERAGTDTCCAVLARLGMGPRVRKSVDTVLALAAAEAQTLAKAAEGTGAELRCDRAGCGAALPSQQALKYHLHVHRLHESMCACKRCDHEFETRRELAMHRCMPTRPTQRVFGRAISIACCVNAASVEL